MSEELKELSKLIGVDLPQNLIEKTVKVEDGHFNLETTSTKAKDLMKALYNEDTVYHLSMITGYEEGKSFSVCYHLMYRNEPEETEVPINFYVKGINKEKPVTPSMVDFFVSADYYEREIYDFFGVIFEGHPELTRLILPEDWPADIRPMKKEYSWQDVKKVTMDMVKKQLEEK